MTDLVVTDDLVEAALELYLDVEPRTLALSGGSTPRPLYERLAQVPYPWEQVDVLFTDERCVPPDHAHSNFRMVDEALLSRLARRPRVHRMPGETCDADTHERHLREVFGDRIPLDLAVLGLGADGHTASLFAGDPALEETGRWVADVERPDHPRLTLTLAALSSAAAAMFLVTGEEKRPALRRLVAGDDIPATRVRANRVLALADPAAAGGRR